MNREKIKEKTAVMILENHHEVNDMSIDIIGKEIIKKQRKITQ